jgi:hypothetical protein
VTNPSLWDVVLQKTPICLWAYNSPMQIVNFKEHSNNQLGASGICPHCGSQSYFHPSATHIENTGQGTDQRGVSAAKCQSCKNFVLVLGFRNAHGYPFQLTAVYPLGKPKDEVDANVSPSIAADFSEALRCQWIKAYKGCVVMCRRAVQASALKLGAPKKQKLDKQIDWLFGQGKITEALKDFAHEVRLTGNVGAHPDRNSGEQPVPQVDQSEDDPETDALEDVTPKDADDIVEFTREYLHHVYVMPAKLKARKKTPSGATPAATQ